MKEDMLHLEQEEDLTPMALPARPERPVKRLIDRLHVDDNPSFERPGASKIHSFMRRQRLD